MSETGMTTSPRRGTRTFLAFAITALSSACAIGQTLTIGYLTRPGLADMENGNPTGAFLPTAVAAAKASGIDHKFESLPQARVIGQTTENVPNYCAVGIYWTEEREKIGKFSAPLYRDTPFQIFTTKAKEARIRKHASFAELVKDTSLKLGLITPYSYSRQLDEFLAPMQGQNVQRVKGHPSQLFTMLDGDRIDYLLSQQEDSGPNMQKTGVDASKIVRISLPDMPSLGPLRHFWCSKSVDDAVVKKLSAGIALQKTNVTNPGIK